MAAIPAIKRYEGSGTVAVLKVISPPAAAGPGERIVVELNDGGVGVDRATSEITIAVD
jgi:hypothetical protein